MSITNNHFSSLFVKSNSFRVFSNLWWSANKRHTWIQDNTNKQINSNNKERKTKCACGIQTLNPLCKNVGIIGMKRPYLYHHRFIYSYNAHLAVKIYNKYANFYMKHLSCSPLKWYVLNYVMLMFTTSCIYKASITLNDWCLTFSLLAMNFVVCW